MKSKILVRMTSNQIETPNCICQDKVEPKAELSSASTISASSNEIDTVSVDDVEKLASEIAPEDENWCAPEENYREAQQ